jgi:metal-responsive CopG/Arc/MetJ family transcriptional regulator
MGSKVKVGFSLERELLEKIDAIIEASRYLEPSQSEVVEAILAAFFKSPLNHMEKARELIIKRRKGLL